ncbi:ornithine cyclodeaminase family protein [Carboxydochorda subterranea]|uniref:Ornithine cyclodeaminase family protein n=1 Tax=Carboxydichorda subterranea TaxID=3109565 RepID=A0ABZ1BYF6_9FIRM|nr:ornithine cyclodeaminase family protein [Limnochorda sp. L945t]WRP17846.1 ornithine cyclodeaminase family protein [Limnochorda sp. L945t]
MREVLYLSRADVEALGPSPSEIVRLMEELFRAKAAGRVELPPKPGIHPRPDAFIHAMPAYIASLDAAGLKWVAGYPGNSVRGLPYIHGLLLLNDAETGVPVAIMDATWITAMRTAAVSALAALYLAAPGRITLAILGLGVQARSHLQTMAAVLAVAEVRAYDRDPARTATFVRDAVQLAPGVSVVPCDTPAQAVRGATVIVTAGPIARNPRPSIRPEWLADGSLLLPIDFDSMVTPEAMAACRAFIVDDAGQYAYYRSIGYFASAPVAPEGELGDVIAGRLAGRTRPEERITSVNLGLAMEDVGLGYHLYRAAIERGVGTRLPL